MFALVLSLAAPLFSLVLLIAANGFFNTFISVRLEMEGYANEAIGAVASSLYFGILCGSAWLDRWIGKIGHSRAFVSFASLFTTLVLAQSFFVDPYYWGTLRFIGGVCIAGIFIVIESWLLVQASPSMRGSILSVYLAIFYAALSGGQLLINLSDPSGIYPFIITAILSAASALPLCMIRVSEPKIEHVSRFTLVQLYRASPLGFLGGVISGMLLAAVYGLVPAYGKEIGMSISEIGNWMAVLIFGGFCFQWPLGQWADRGDRRRVLIAASLLTAMSCVAIALCHSIFFLLLFSYVFGGFSFAIYPLSMAYACEKLTSDQIVPATGGFVLSYGLGAIAGPLIAPLAMNLFGPSGLFYFFGAISLLLASFGLKKRVKTDTERGHP